MNTTHHLSRLPLRARDAAFIAVWAACIPVIAVASLVEAWALADLGLDE